MSRVVDLLCSRRVPQVAVLALMSIGFAGCSADMSTRFADNPFNSRSETTGSVRGAPYAAPTPRVERQELPQYSRPQPQQQQSYTSSSLPPPVSAPQSYPSYPTTSGTSGGGRGVSSYDPPARPRIESTGTVASRSVAAAPAQHAAPAHGHGNGTTIIVGTSDTLEGLSRRYNVSSAEILRANGYKGPRALRPGQQLVIPSRQTAHAQPAPVAPAPAPKVAAAAPVSAAAATHYVNRGDTLMSIARRNHISVTELARANRIPPTTQLKIGSKIVVPGRKVAAAAPAVVGAPPAQLGATAPSVPAQPAPVHVAQAPTEPVQKARMASAVETPAAAAEAAPSPVKSAEATGALPTFRWPVRGRVVTAYGAKTNGKANDGINVAVPEGTPVKAAEDGVVAYAGNELKGYGNLVLVRHSNGYVTAYAHASQLLVKRGETIKRGQTIAKSGQSGEAGSPQLHFEIRKGSTPVDPLKFLNGA
ncbi:MAG: LysM peptidoglycan-binding domain-containing M23 family metallopeptidase [Rhizobiales bacterium]|nr:LysM peptidoglycan-binding domain-containing M23 family metallopeptidase [Hyphomicrobiales bacterium]